SIFGLVVLRLCTSVSVAARQQKQRPHDAYLSVSQGPIRDTLPALAALDPATVEATLRQARGKTPEDTLASRRRVIGPNLSVAYREPVKAVRGWMQYLYDHAGRRYLDAYNNVPHVGHSHPRVVRAGIEQMLLLNTNTRYLHDGLAGFAERLIATLPDPLRVCYFVSSGSEANELALRLARAHTRRRDVIVMDGAYHGNTTTLVDISPYKFNGPGGEGARPWVHVVPIPDTYRGKFRRDDPRAGEKYAEVARQVRNPSAFIAESAPSVGGQIILPDGYLAHVYAIVRAAGGVCIADEVQTAYGRMGTCFYAFESQRVVPDIVVLGKPIGNGYPLGAVVTTPEIAASFDNGMEFFSTFGGSTVACAVGLAVLDVVQEEHLQEHARETGAALLDALRALAGRHPLIGDVRGSGLFLGVELVKDRDTLEPAGAEASDIANRMRERGILIGTDGPFANVLKIRPPMPFTRENGEHLVATLDEVLGG
ncbi:MAG TPA: aminotransferase class III-fold pyridoxal phosphate-dependent enzyme, partial [Vicinamibacterales bacterium]